ncbi:MAG: hypothetical protein RR578_02170 [Bacilli bacterium]
MEKMNNKSAKVILSPDEKQHQRINKYIDNVAQKTSNIEVVEYVNSRIKATYKCKSCGHIWSARSDHFKDQQKSKCPICKK